MVEEKVQDYDSGISSDYYKVEFLPEPKEIPLPMLDEASLDIDRKRFRTEHEIRAEHEN